MNINTYINNAGQYNYIDVNTHVYIQIQCAIVNYIGAK